MRTGKTFRLAGVLLVLALGRLLSGSVNGQALNESPISFLKYEYSESGVSGGMTYVYATNLHSKRAIQFTAQVAGRAQNPRPEDPVPRPATVTRLLGPRERILIYSEYVFGPIKASTLSASFAN
jgi:hypothetical protein